MKHEEHIEQIYALVDGLLSPEEEEEINEHLAQCDECRTLHQSLISDDKAIGDHLETLCQSNDFHDKVLESTERLAEQSTERKLFRSAKSFLSSRRAIYAAAAIMLFVAALTAGISYLHERESRFGVIAKLNGLAWCKRGNLQFVLSSGNQIRCGDEVITENDSIIHLITKEHHVITLNSNTRLMIGENNRVRQEICLAKGEVFIDSNGQGRKYTLKALDSEIRNIGTKFDVRVIPAEFAPAIVNVAVESGKAIVDTTSKSIDVESGEKIVLVENHVERFEKLANLDQITKWRWNLRNLLPESSEKVWKESDPFTGRTWVAEKRRFILPDDSSAEEYDILQKLLISMRERLARSIEATSVAFAQDYIYIGTAHGIFRYSRQLKTVSLIILDYGIIGSDITKISISENGDIFDISFRRPGNNLIEHSIMNENSFPMILNFDPLTLQPVAVAR